MKGGPRYQKSRHKRTSATVLTQIAISSGFFVRRTRCYSDTASGRVQRSQGTRVSVARQEARSHATRLQGRPSL